MKRALIIGYGYLGQRVAARWLDEDWKVYASTRRANRRPTMEQVGLVPLCYDVLAGGDPLPQVDVVVYCVGFDRSAGIPMREVYVDGLEKTLSRLPPPHRFIYISSTGVFGDAQGAWLDEETTPAPTDPGGVACWEAEQVLRDASIVARSSPVILRLAGIYGPDRLIGAQGLREGRPVAGDPEGWLNLIHVDDAAQVVCSAALKQQIASCYIVSDGQPVLRREFYHFLSDQLGTPPPTFVPATSGRARGGRRLSARRMMEDLQPILLYPHYRDGLEAIIRGSNTGTNLTTS